LVVTVIIDVADMSPNAFSSNIENGDLATRVINQLLPNTLPMHFEPRCLEKWIAGGGENRLQFEVGLLCQNLAPSDLTRSAGLSWSSFAKSSDSVLNDPPIFLGGAALLRKLSIRLVRQ
jgi:hypothetical protein